ncbi:MAG TPA: cysteine--tRNA ligase [bacterium]|nr:cysteine--tRNA ligase [bacterium]
MRLFNSVSRKKEDFVPLKPGAVGIYACGPTVYHYAHIGNLRAYIFEDILRRVLEMNAYQVRHVTNLTDVGHLTDDGDAGEDKMEKAKRREGKNSWEIAEYYIDALKKDWQSLNLKEPFARPRATAYIDEQIEIVKILEKKGYTYKISDGIYFDTSKIKDYGKIAMLDVENLQAGARVEINPEKKNKTDFALWKFSPKDSKRDMEWDSPWGVGFPGWHTECLAMSLHLLNGHKDYEHSEPFDIHCGGADLLPVHHTNEIAQSEALAGHKLAEYWLHNEFVVLAGDAKMSKSSGNFFTLSSLEEMGYHPLSYRYLCLGSHYRSKLNFSVQALEGAQRAYMKILNYMALPTKEKGKVNQKYGRLFSDALNDDLNVPKGLAVVWDLLKNEDVSLADTQATLLNWDAVLGLRLHEAKQVLQEIDELQTVPDNVKELAEKRWQAKKARNWEEADSYRDQVLSLGFVIEDMADNYKIKKNYGE